MGIKRYTDAQIMWLEVNGCSRVWKNRAEFRTAFNKLFGLNVDVYKFNNLIDYYKIKICSKQSESIFSEEQKQWLIDNAKSGRFKTCKHLTDTYNALFKECRKSENVTSYLWGWGVQLNTEYKKSYYSSEMDSWLKNNYLSFDVGKDAVNAFNKMFGTNKSEAALMHHCRNIGLNRTSTRFRKGMVTSRSRNIGDVVRRQDEAWIKVNSDGGKHNWIPLRKYVWEQAYGKVPDGYCVVFLTDNYDDVSLKNLALIDRRGTVVMSKMDWWSSNNIITGSAVQWCNLYMTAKDNGVYAEID